MKKNFFVALSISAVLALSACGSPKIAGDSPENKGTPPAVNIEVTPDTNPGNIPQGITVNKVEFEVLGDNLPEELSSLIDENKSQKGFMVTQIEEEYYVVVFMGEQNSGGYSLEVESIEDNEGRTVIYVNENKPDKDAIVTMALTYPYQAVKIKSGISPDFRVVNQIGDEYDELK